MAQTFEALFQEIIKNEIFIGMFITAMVDNFFVLHLIDFVLEAAFQNEGFFLWLDRCLQTTKYALLTSYAVRRPAVASQY